jgi:arylsulfatase A-like enzyme
MYKSFMYEGGIAVPAIAWGPGVKRGEVKGAMAHVTDIAPTLFDLARTRHPGTEYQGKPVLPLRGKSMVPYLQGQAKAVRGDSDTVGWELGGRKALRKGDWKIVFANAPWGTNDWELFNVAEGPHRKPQPRREPTRRSWARCWWPGVTTCARPARSRSPASPTAPATATAPSTTRT